MLKSDAGSLIGLWRRSYGRHLADARTMLAKNKDIADSAFEHASVNGVR